MFLIELFVSDWIVCLILTSIWFCSQWKKASMVSFTVALSYKGQHRTKISIGDKWFSSVFFSPNPSFCPRLKFSPSLEIDTVIPTVQWKKIYLVRYKHYHLEVNATQRHQWVATSWDSYFCLRLKEMSSYKFSDTDWLPYGTAYSEQNTVFIFFCKHSHTECNAVPKL